VFNNGTDHDNDAVYVTGGDTDGGGGTAEGGTGAGAPAIDESPEPPQFANPKTQFAMISVSAVRPDERFISAFFRTNHSVAMTLACMAVEGVLTHRRSPSHFIRICCHEFTWIGA